MFSKGEGSKSAFMLVYSRVSEERTRQWMRAEKAREEALEAATAGAGAGARARARAKGAAPGASIDAFGS